MATRSLICFENSNICVYKHWDGYPEHMLPWLENFSAQFIAERGWDESYMIAQLLRFSKEHEQKYDLDPSNTTGWGVMIRKSEWDNKGAEYIYTIKKDGTITVKQE